MNQKKTTSIFSALSALMILATPLGCVDRIQFPGDAEDGATGGRPGGLIAGGGADSGSGEGSSICPAALPTEGAVCSRTQTQCDYTIPDVYCGTRTALCDSGTWKILTPSCPPPPCPESAPAVGDSCESPGRECIFGSCEDGSGARFSCGVAGVWEPLDACSCPGELPAEGARCDAGQSCSYTVPETYCGFRQATCEGSAWKIYLPSCPPPRCPDVSPTLGTGCDFRWHTCSYGGCGTNDATSVTCGSSDVWIEAETACP